MVPVISAGNSGPGSGTVGTPGTARHAITVAASDKTDKIADFSSRGPVVFYENEIEKVLLKPDVTAPGVDICAAEYDSAWSDSRCLDSRHVAISGTSMAAPHVSGSAALIKQAHPGWTPGEIKSALKVRSFDLGYRSTVEGAGRVDVLASVRSGRLPEVSIEPPLYVNGTVEIRGTASSPTLTGWSVYYSKDDISWQQACSSASSVDDGILCAWHTGASLSGLFTLKLIATNPAGSAEDRSIVLVNVTDFDPNRWNNTGTSVTLDRDYYNTIRMLIANTTLDCNGHTINAMLFAPYSCPYIYYGS